MASKLTQFGIACRTQRIQRDKVISDQAQALDLSPAYISQIETGKRPIPDRYPQRFADWLRLEDGEARLLFDIADAQAEDVTLFPADQLRAKLAHSFGRGLNNLTEIEVLELRAIFETRHQERPEHQKLDSLISSVRTLLVGERVCFDAVRLLENLICTVEPSFFLRIESDDQFAGGVRGFLDVSNPAAPHVVVSERTYKGGAAGQGDARFSLIHEFAHFLMHRKHAHARSADPFPRFPGIERQADWFTEQFLLPDEQVNKFDDPHRLSRIAQVPVWLAKKRMKALGLWNEINPAIVDGLHELQKTLAKNPDNTLPIKVHTGCQICVSPDLVDGDRNLQWFANYKYRG